MRDKYIHDPYSFMRGFCETCAAETSWTAEEDSWECVVCGLIQDFTPDSHLIVEGNEYD